ncbi:hypothetical protein TB2_008723 [Malus domestica]
MDIPEQIETIKIPTRVEEALKDSKWRKAMQVEMEALQKNNTLSVETFSHVAKMNIIRVLLSLATNHDWPLRQ